ncbi:hypothetical protein [Advenella sp. EE-W14]|uniref:hypothetical protein n=1 Tax=Advenella sp. EE-W14 TaxID=2722705 RepID=UPI00145FBE60|nr:hypothetical protein [Advenella sp. EE-W14]
MSKSGRDLHIHCARVYLQEARRFRHCSFHAILLAWARNNRLLAGNESSKQTLLQLELIL